MYKPDLDEARNLADDYRVIPLSMEIFADVRTPIEVLRILKGVDAHCFLLESVEKAERWGRYSFLGFAPSMEITCHDSKLTLKTDEKTEIINTDEPQKYIKRIIEDNRSPRLDFLPPFTGGLVGYFSYDFIKYFEPKLKLDACDEENFKDVDLMLFDKVIAFDNLRQKIVLIVNIKTDNLEENYKKGTVELQKLASLIKNGFPKKSFTGQIEIRIPPSF